jgi:hypothetical protein
MTSDSQSPDSLRSKLAAELELVPWQELKSHALADRIFVVGSALDLLDVAVAIATDAVAEIEVWSDQGLLARPTVEDIAAYDTTPQRSFHCVIVQPFVLIRDPGPAISQAQL